MTKQERKVISNCAVIYIQDMRCKTDFLSYGIKSYKLEFNLSLYLLLQMKLDIEH